MSDYIPLEEDVGIEGWNMRVHEGPLPFSATEFDEEDKLILRSLSSLMRAMDSPEILSELRRMHNKYGIKKFFQLVELIGREQGR